LDINNIEILDNLNKEDLFDWGVCTINAPKIWYKANLGEGVTIVTIDTGVNVDHPDLKDRVKSTFNMIDKNFNVEDKSGHGTHVAGLLVGKNTGVAPKADLHVIKVLDEDGRGDIRSVMDGITHAMNLKADILTISLGTMQDIPLILKQRIVDAYSAGVTIVSATGNAGRAEPYYPARMNEVIGVGGLDKDMNLTMFTNMGYDVLAPSVEILSTYKDNNYARMTGTSMASPLVAGGIALLISYYRKQGKELRPHEIKAMLGEKFDLTDLIG
jgi:subtilisin family serine protease